MHMSCENTQHLHIQKSIVHLRSHPAACTPASPCLLCVKLATTRGALTFEARSAKPSQTLQQPSQPNPLNMVGKPSQTLQQPSQQTPHETPQQTSRFHQTHGRFPGSYDDTVEDDVAMLKAAAGQVLGELGASGAAVQDDLVGEMCRWVRWWLPHS